MPKSISITRQLETYPSTADALRDHKLTYEIQVIQQDVIETNRYLSKKFELPLATPLFLLKRLRIVEGQPKTIETSYIPYHFVPDIEKKSLKDVSFYDFLKEHYQISIMKSEEEILLVHASEEEKDMLHPMKDKILLLKGRTYDEELRTIEYFENAAVPDFYVFRSVSEL